MSDEELKRGFSMKVIKRKALTRSVIGGFDLSTPLNVCLGLARSPHYDLLSYAPTAVIARSPEGATWQSPYVSGDYLDPCPTSSCATRLRGLLRRFGDSLLAMTTGRTTLVYVLDAVPKVCELMQ